MNGKLPADTKALRAWLSSSRGPALLLAEKLGYVEQVGTTASKDDPFGEEVPLLTLTEKGRTYINLSKIRYGVRQ